MLWGLQGRTCSKGGLGGNGTTLEAPLRREGSRENSAIPRVAAGFDTGDKLLYVLANVPFKLWGRGQVKNSQARNYFIEKPKLQTALKTNTQLSAEFSWGLGGIFPPHHLYQSCKWYQLTFYFACTFYCSQPEFFLFALCLYAFL